MKKGTEKRTMCEKGTEIRTMSEKGTEIRRMSETKRERKTQKSEIAKEKEALKKRDKAKMR